MAKFHVEMKRTASATLAVGNVIADATRPRRLAFTGFIFGCQDTPADGVFLLEWKRCTTAGTATGVTPVMLDPSDVATEADAAENHSVDPTITAIDPVMSVALNQRATFRWQASPGNEIIVPATASNGLVLKTPTVATLTVTASTYWDEK